MGCPQPKGSFSSSLLNIAAVECVFNGAVKEASEAEADGWRGTNASEIGVEREALYLGDREQEEVEPWLPGRPCRRSCARRAAGAPRDAHSGTSREPGAGNRKC